MNTVNKVHREIDRWFQARADAMTEDLLSFIGIRGVAGPPEPGAPYGRSCHDSLMFSGELLKKLQDRVYREASEGVGVIIPPIAYYEIKRGLIEANTTTKLQDFERLSSMIGIDVIDTETLDIAATI